MRLGILSRAGIALSGLWLLVVPAYHANSYLGLLADADAKFRAACLNEPAMEGCKSYSRMATMDQFWFTWSVHLATEAARLVMIWLCVLIIRAVCIWVLAGRKNP